MGMPQSHIGTYDSGKGGLIEISTDFTHSGTRMPPVSILQGLRNPLANLPGPFAPVSAGWVAAMKTTYPEMKGMSSFEKLRFLEKHHKVAGLGSKGMYHDPWDSNLSLGLINKGATHIVGPYGDFTQRVMINNPSAGSPKYLREVLDMTRTHSRSLQNFEKKYSGFLSGNLDATIYTPRGLNRGETISIMGEEQQYTSIMSELNKDVEAARALISKHMQSADSKSIIGDIVQRSRHRDRYKRLHFDLKQRMWKANKARDKIRQGSAHGLIGGALLGTGTLGVLGLRSLNPSASKGFTDEELKLKWPSTPSVLAAPTKTDHWKHINSLLNIEETPEEIGSDETNSEPIEIGE